MLDAPDHAAMIDRITNATFNTTGLKPGYDEKEVDDFLDQVIAQLRAGGLPEIREARFSVTRMRPGYVQQDVDDLLDEIDLYAEPHRSSDHAAMVDRITNATFNTTRLKPRYDEKEVDDFLDLVMARLRAGGLPEVGGARFSLTRTRPGYVQQDVDDLLHEIDLYAEARRSALGARAGERNPSHRIRRLLASDLLPKRAGQPGQGAGAHPLRRAARKGDDRPGGHRRHRPGRDRGLIIQSVRYVRELP